MAGARRHFSTFFISEPASASGSLNKTMSGLGGLDGNLTNLNAAEEDKARFMAFDLAMSVPNNKSMKYHFQLMAQGVNVLNLSEETLTQPLNHGPGPMKFINAQHGKVRYWQTADLKRCGTFKRAIRRRN